MGKEEGEPGAGQLWAPCPRPSHTSPGTVRAPNSARHLARPPCISWHCAPYPTSPPDCLHPSAPPHPTGHCAPRSIEPAGSGKPPRGRRCARPALGSPCHCGPRARSRVRPGGDEPGGPRPGPLREPGGGHDAVGSGDRGSAEVPEPGPSARASRCPQSWQPAPRSAAAERAPAAASVPGRGRAPPAPFGRAGPEARRGRPVGPGGAVPPRARRASGPRAGARGRGAPWEAGARTRGCGARRGARAAHGSLRQPSPGARARVGWGNPGGAAPGAHPPRARPR